MAFISASGTRHHAGGVRRRGRRRFATTRATWPKCGSTLATASCVERSTLNWPARRSALKDIIRARNRRRRELRTTLAEREATVEALLRLRRGEESRPRAALPEPDPASTAPASTAAPEELLQRVTSAELTRRRPSSSSRRNIVALPSSAMPAVRRATSACVTACQAWVRRFRRVSIPTGTNWSLCWAVPRRIVTTRLHRAIAAHGGRCCTRQA